VNIVSVETDVVPLRLQFGAERSSTQIDVYWTQSLVAQSYTILYY